ncbi:TPA: NADH-quinone oxidoreductase subunit NuoK [bacterium]|nr:MAG: hypothetical protein AUJ18_00440 [Candidatus Hydrogenedentes bacterium CG1_02_42_14]PIU47914.1 MAG: NADH-quinone oxidoreductase subunit NuoK [Candidatus Hydrogenedentes bacterium CG07_land_8_20_14_0_80_42_17]HBW47185.1 NADH-quinone oxidoreductase subunit NuoK [bacterium]
MNALPPFFALVVGSILFALGLAAITLHRSIIRMLFGIELMLNAAILNFVAFGAGYGDANGAVFAIMIMAGAAAEAAVSLALVFAFFAIMRSSDIESRKELAR